MRPLIACAVVMSMTTPVYSEVVISNSSTVRSVSTASASSGGNVVDEGGVVRTGDASASASTQTTISGDGNLESRVETIVDGVSTVKEERVHVPAGETITVVATSTSRSGADTRAQGTVIKDKEDVSPHVTDDREATSATSFSARLAFIFGRIFETIGPFAWWR